MYDPKYTGEFYDAYGEREWNRFEGSPADLVALHIHKSYLQRYIKPGDHVLDAGAGPGRFTIELARLGARVTVGDLSPVQLRMNEVRVTEAGYEGAIVERAELDITDLSRFGSGTFDATVCYGGPLSYVFEKADVALSELLRVTKPGGYLLLSVMSLIGTVRASLAGVLALAQQYGIDETNRVNSTGNLTGPIAATHRCRLYRWSWLTSLLKRHPCEIVAASASNFLSLNNKDTLENLAADPQGELWQAFLEWELEMCAEPGVLDGGTHILAVVKTLA